ncbi:MAG: hypothetical protein CG446_23, partial [Methanosaeta sp. ASO1]
MARGFLIFFDIFFDMLFKSNLIKNYEKNLKRLSRTSWVLSLNQKLISACFLS